MWMLWQTQLIQLNFLLARLAVTVSKMTAPFRQLGSAAQRSQQLLMDTFGFQTKLLFSVRSFLFNGSCHFAAGCEWQAESSTCC